MRVRRILLLMVVVAFFLLTGCDFAENKDVDHLAITREAVSNQDKLASRHAKLALRNVPGNREAEAILAYLDYGDNMLIAAFWEEDSEALRYLAGIVHDINIKDPRFVMHQCWCWLQHGVIQVWLKSFLKRERIPTTEQVKVD